MERPNSSVERAYLIALEEFVCNLHTKVDAHRLEDLLQGEETIELTDMMWDKLKDQFRGNIRETFENNCVVKPLCDETDGFLGSLYRLSDEQIVFTKRRDENTASTT